MPSALLSFSLPPLSVRCGEAITRSVVAASVDSIGIVGGGAIEGGGGGSFGDSFDIIIPPAGRRESRRRTRKENCERVLRC